MPVLPALNEWLSMQVLHGLASAMHYELLVRTRPVQAAQSPSQQLG